MSVVADKIEKFILNKLREEQENLILKRNELADELDCAPSQISYVLSTRFSNERDLTLSQDVA
jgi:putative transcriptional regulator